ncbi:MAG TPA: aspartate--tRNA ligase [Terriglobales bacterium]|nr:aspartate--tRNA ligase [Terriglobales bacterium]
MTENLQLDPLGTLRRSHYCGELRRAHAGQRVLLMGWVHRRRDLGSLLFLDLRDRSGMCQIVFNRDRAPALHERAGALRSEYVIGIEGEVVERSAPTVNPALATGEVEVVASGLHIFNDARTPPFLLDEAQEVAEEARLKYRYVDLRRPAMQANVRLRHEVTAAIRRYFDSRGFLEIETPFLTRSTPEGARDYLVPSRLQRGSFYALPQSPQLFKQILMMGGCDRYFQIVRCFRDEDLRADRQPEFTQIDVELSFPQEETVYELIEGMLAAAFAAGGSEIATPFPRLSWEEAMARYGSDKPDLRLPAMSDVRAHFAPEELEQLKLAAEEPVLAIRIPRVGALSRSQRDELRPLAEGRPVRFFEDFGRLAKSFPATTERIGASIAAGEGDLVTLVGAPAGARRQRHEVATHAGALRLALAQHFAERHGLLDARDFRFLWVTSFPMFEWDETEKRWAAAHHPFTSPREDDWERLESEPGLVKARAYDVVLNGTELGSGSIRIHRSDLQSRIFRLLGMDEDEARQRFGFFLEALQYGTPPHGGIALGLDRLVMILAGENSIREVIPFPKTARGVDLMVDAPTPVSAAQLRELGVQVTLDSGR